MVHPDACSLILRTVLHRTAMPPTKPKRGHQHWPGTPFSVIIRMEERFMKGPKQDHFKVLAFNLKLGFDWSQIYFIYHMEW
jgi:hypothetical protein